MTVYVDDLQDYGFTDWRKGEWAHMWSDSIAELHTVADLIGLDRKYFQNRPGFPHYDLRPSKRKKLLSMYPARVREIDIRTWLKEQSGR